LDEDATDHQMSWPNDLTKIDGIGYVLYDHTWPKALYCWRQTAPSGGQDRMIIDSHTHVISQDAARYPADPLGGHRSTWSQDRPVDGDGLLTAMDKAGIDKAVVVQASTVYGHDNRYVAEVVAAHRDRLVGVFSVDVLADDGLDQMKRWLDAGLCGLRLFTTGSTMPGQASWLDDPRSFPVWAHAEAQAVPVCLQMTADGIPMLLGLLARFPKVRVLLDHLARPRLSDGPPYAAAKALFDLAEHPGVFLKFTNRTIAAAGEGASTPPAFIARLVEAFGADRIAWGSNFPAAEGELAALFGEARAALGGLAAVDQAKIFAGTISGLYPALRETTHA
jgi:predicted TIM-barrel fold metal-dependent hydrolase